MIEAVLCDINRLWTRKAWMKLAHATQQWSQANDKHEVFLSLSFTCCCFFAFILLRSRSLVFSEKHVETIRTLTSAIQIKLNWIRSVIKCLNRELKSGLLPDWNAALGQTEHCKEEQIKFTVMSFRKLLQGSCSSWGFHTLLQYVGLKLLFNPSWPDKSTLSIWFPVKH